MMAVRFNLLNLDRILVGIAWPQARATRTRNVVFVCKNDSEDILINESMEQFVRQDGWWLK